MTKPFALALTLGLALVLAPVAHAANPVAANPVAVNPVPPAPLVSLKANGTVDGAAIRLGDLFDGAGAHADDVVAKAPAPGTSMLFDVGWLYSTARAHGVNWLPPSTESAIRIQRNATVIETTELAQQLADKLPSTLPLRRVELDAQFRLYVPVGGSTDITVQKVDLKPETGRFSAEVRVASDDPDAAPVHVSGRIVGLMTVPVLARPMMPGEVVRAEDITTADFRVDQIQAGGIMDPRELVGETPRHPLRAAQPLRANDVQVPVVVKRNDLVLIVLEKPGLYLTAEGRALEDGGKGNVIRVTNTQSKRTIDAVVLAPGQVAIRAPGIQQAYN
ncbi:flagellar basal body P-ring biosynthesis protein FlgA [Aliidongia dinghuensis]|uniref:Flagellar basal body P-ring biosynthesis protein FlgA n=1 Tax=Aliidongia dinghuensis TaxID=1867774 RepID=A0A8J2YZ25_9PROT|nr:flagellar basal body P-ring formation chaperone FlgA [Aliidongia dinghuensis]GGF38962.1 flagellar basal body P-ring biosynthesis protein FlgA [Aliidongia dinghuensis]